MYIYMPTGHCIEIYIFSDTYMYIDEVGTGTCICTCLQGTDQEAGKVLISLSLQHHIPVIYMQVHSIVILHTLSAQEPLMRELAPCFVALVHQRFDVGKCGDCQLGQALNVRAQHWVLSDGGWGDGKGGRQKRGEERGGEGRGEVHVYRRKSLPTDTML